VRCETGWRSSRTLFSVNDLEVSILLTLHPSHLSRLTSHAFEADRDTLSAKATLAGAEWRDRVITIAAISV
jgi:hypothetical protein